MPKAPEATQQAVAGFHRKYPPAPARDDAFLSPVRLQIESPDPAGVAEAMVEELRGSPPGRDLVFSHAELTHDEARGLWFLLVWFAMPLTQDQIELRTILDHNKDRDFPTLKAFKNFLLEVLPLPAYNRACLVFEKSGLTELKWQQHRAREGKTPGVAPHLLMREAMRQGGKPIMFGDNAEMVRKALDARPESGHPPPST